MKYSLIVKLENDCYEISNYSKLPGFEYLNETKLKDIVEFTNLFEDEYELINFLIETNLIPEKYLQGTLSINYRKGKDSLPKQLQYGISFCEDKKFFDTIFLKHFYREKLKNENFMSLFVEKYYSYLKDINPFSSDLYYLRHCYEYYTMHQYLPRNAEDAMNNFIETYCRKKSKEGYYKADFTRIRDLAMFAIDYERNFERPIIEKPKYKENEIKLLINHYETLLRNESLTVEEEKIYTDALEKLELELEMINNNLLNRRIKDEITRN